MYKGIEIIQAGYSSVAWNVTFQALDNQKENKLKIYAVRYNGTEGYVISASENGKDFIDIINPAQPKDIAYLLPRNFVWEFSEFKAMIVGFSAGFDRGYNENRKLKIAAGNDG